MSLRRKLTAVVFLLIEGTTIKFLWLQSREDTFNILQDKLVGGKFLSASFLSFVTATSMLDMTKRNKESGHCCHNGSKTNAAYINEKLRANTLNMYVKLRVTTSF